MVAGGTTCEILRAIAADEDPREIVARWQPEIAAFAAVRDRFLLY